MEKKIVGSLLLSAIALVTILASAVPSLYALGNAMTIVANAAPSLYEFSNTTQTPTVPQPPSDHAGPPWMANLTDTQKATLKQKMEELKAAGKSPEEVRNATDVLLKEWGIAVPQPPSSPPP